MRRSPSHLLSGVRAAGLALALVGLAGCGGPTEEQLSDGGYLLETASEGLTAAEIAAPDIVQTPVQSRVARVSFTGPGALPTAMGLTAPVSDPTGTGATSDTSPDPIPARGGDGSPAANPSTRK